MLRKRSLKKPGRIGREPQKITVAISTSLCGSSVVGSDCSGDVAWHVTYPQSPTGKTA